MVWSLETSNGLESDKIAAFVIPYTRGRGLDLGCGTRKVWPHVIGFDNNHHGENFGFSKSADITGDSRDLGMFSDGSFDFIFSSHMLEHIPREEVPTQIAHWASKIKIGGYLILYVPSGNLYPKCQPTFEPGCNPDHKWDIYPGDIASIIAEATTCGWTQLEGEERSGSNEYSLFEVYQKRDDGQLHQNIWQRNPNGQKRALVIRYGALGDQIITSSIFPQLKEQGYHVTYNTTQMGWDVCQNDPNIDAFFLQDKDQVPNSQLHPYWDSLASRYDKVINLCESIEVGLLAQPDRLPHSYPQAVRHKLMNVNYLERTHDISDVPHVFNPRFYPTEPELHGARLQRHKIKAPCIAWVVNGSSPHKVYPHTDSVMAWLLKNTPLHIFIYADPKIGKAYQDAMIAKLAKAGYDTSRLHPTAGIWPIRDALTFLQFVDAVVGPETGPLNAVCMEDVPKVIYLSHSSHENLTKYWKNTTVLEPDKAKVPCWPCHQLHSDWTHCNKDEESGGAACAASIAPETIFKAIADQLVKHQKMQVA